MHIERERLKTYNSFGKPWVSRDLLARSGLFYSQCSDLTVCYCCKVMIDCWQEEDDVMENHLRFSPKCPLLAGKATDNVPIDPEVFLKSLPEIPNDVCEEGNSVIEGLVNPEEIKRLDREKMNALAEKYGFELVEK